MTNKKKGLAETFIQNEERLQQSENAERAEQSEQSENIPQAPTQPEPEPKPNTRSGKKHIGGYFDTDVWAQLKIMSVEKGGMTLQDILAEALNTYFTVNDKPPIAK